MSGDWLRNERADVAVERILDAAAQLFVDRGVAAVGMKDLAKAAGCSRATLYRYFDNRRSLQLAFVHREARRIGVLIAEQVSGTAEPGLKLVEAILAAVHAVRSAPTLAAWFQLDDAGISAEIAHSSEVIEALGVSFLVQAGMTGDEVTRTARWIVRIIISLLTVPGVDEADERAMLEQFVAPVVTRINLPS